MSFPIRPSIHVTRSCVKSSNGTRGGLHIGGLLEEEDSDIKVIVPLNLLNKLRLTLREEQAESARKDEQITNLHTLLRKKNKSERPVLANDSDSAENRCLHTFLNLSRSSVDFYHKRSGELERILIPLLDPDSQRWHFPYANMQNYVVECINGLMYVKITGLSPGGFLDMVLPEQSSVINS